MAHFGIWQDETMQTPFSAVHFSRDLTDANTPKRGRFWFGAKEAYLMLQTKVNAGVDNITLTPTFALATISRSTAYAIGNCNDYVLNCYIYRLTTAGTTATNAPTYSTNLGDTITDGTAVFVCVSKAHSTNEIKLSLTGEAGLSNAQAGAAVSLGNTVNGGGGIEIWYQVTDSVDNVFNMTCPQLCIAINECEEKQVNSTP